MSGYKIRLGAPEDTENIVYLCYRFFGASEYFIDGFNLEVVREKVNWYFNTPKEQAIIFVLEHEEEGVVGVLAGVAVPSFFNKDFWAMEQVWWVQEKHRTGHSLKLVKAFEAWAKHVGCSKILMMGPEKNPQIKRIYEGLGFSPTEYTYQKNIKDS